MPRKKKIVAPPAPPMSPGGAMLPGPGGMPPMPGALPGAMPGMPPGMPPMPPKMAPKPPPIKRKMGKTMKVKDVVKAKPF